MTVDGVKLHPKMKSYSELPIIGRTAYTHALYYVSYASGCGSQVFSFKLLYSSSSCHFTHIKTIPD